MRENDPLDGAVRPDLGDTRAMRADEDVTIVRHEEEVTFSKARRPSGTLRAVKHVDVDVVTETMPVNVEYVEMERTVAGPDDDGETRVLPDGSVSIAVLEERIVTRTETFVAERITLRKFTNVEERTVEAEVRKERVEIDDSETPGRVVDANQRGARA
ncbi:MAG: hypothetical protein JWM98_2341 [Thermoleophilia bacterium]|nr:hypothetical protein [Thermoleophilia bacterium]